MRIESFTLIQDEGDEDDVIEEAISRAGLIGAIAPRPGTEAYRRLKSAAIAYMVEVKKVEKPATILDPTYNSRDNYFNSKPKIDVEVISDKSRKRYHDEMAMMLLGKKREDLTAKEEDQISNFAAYMTGEEEYIDTWH